MPDPDILCPGSLDNKEQLPLLDILQYAVRYRWLREQDWFSSEFCVLRFPKARLTQPTGLGADCPSRGRLDTFIDEAIAKEKS